jgi:hypothetical protein
VSYYSNSAGIQSGKQQYLPLKLNSRIPNHASWIVNMWHFGHDSHTEFSGREFQIAWKDSLNIFHHIYSKEYGNKIK